jgi:hypothetical protein
LFITRNAFWIAQRATAQPKAGIDHGCDVVEAPPELSQVTNHPEELQLHQNHEKFLFFDCAVALCTMRNALLVISNLT